MAGSIGGPRGRTSGCLVGIGQGFFYHIDHEFFDSDGVFGIGPGCHTAPWWRGAG